MNNIIYATLLCSALSFTANHEVSQPSWADVMDKEQPLKHEKTLLDNEDTGTSDDEYYEAESESEDNLENLHARLELMEIKLNRQASDIDRHSTATKQEINGLSQRIHTLQRTTDRSFLRLEKHTDDATINIEQRIGSINCRLRALEENQEYILRVLATLSQQMNGFMRVIQPLSVQAYSAPNGTTYYSTLPPQ